MISKSESFPEVKIQIINSSLNSNFSLDLNRSENNPEPNIVFELKNSIKSNSIPIDLINDDFSFKCSMSSDQRSNSCSNQKDFAALCKLLHKKKVSYISKITPASALRVKTKEGVCVGLKPKVLINLLSRQSLLIIFIPQKNDNNISLAEECRIQDATDFSTSLSQTSAKFVNEWVKKCNNIDTAKIGSDDDINSFEFCSLQRTPTSDSNYNKSPKNKNSLSRKRSSSGKLNRSLSIISMSMQSSSSSLSVSHEKINHSKDQIKSFDSKATDGCDEVNDACKNLNMCIDFCKKLTKPLISHYADILKCFNAYLQVLSGTECIQSHFILLQQEFANNKATLCFEIQIIIEIIIIELSQKHPQINSGSDILKLSTITLLDHLTELSLLTSSQDLNKLMNDLILELFINFCPSLLVLIFKHFYGALPASLNAINTVDQSQANQDNSQFNSPPQPGKLNSRLLNDSMLSPISFGANFLTSPCDALKADLKLCAQSPERIKRNVSQNSSSEGSALKIQCHSKRDSTPFGNNVMQIKSVPLTIHSPIASLQSKTSVRRSKSFVSVIETPKKKIKKSTAGCNSSKITENHKNIHNQLVIPKSPTSGTTQDIQTINPQYSCLNDDKSSSPIGVVHQNSIVSPNRDHTLSKSFTFYSNDNNEASSQSSDSSFRRHFSFITQPESTLTISGQNSCPSSPKKLAESVTENNKENIPPAVAPDKIGKSSTVAAKRRLFTMMNDERDALNFDL